MKWIIVWLFVAFAGLAMAHAQVEPRLYINDVSVGSDQVSINYDITFGGFVEIHLFDESGKKVWINGVVNNRVGTYTFRVPGKPLKPGQRYTFFFRYKGAEYHGSFYAS